MQDRLNNYNCVVFVCLFESWKQILKIQVELLRLITHVGCHDYGLTETEPGIHENVRQQVILLILGRQHDELTILEDHLLLSQSSSVGVVSINFTQVKALIWIEFLLELPFPHHQLASLGFDIIICNVNSTSDLRNASSMFNLSWRHRVVISRSLSKLFSILQSPHYLTVSSSELSLVSRSVNSRLLLLEDSGCLTNFVNFALKLTHESDR